MRNYSEYFNREYCGLCRTSTKFVPCQGCQNEIRPQNLQKYQDLQMCKNCILQRQPPPQPQQYAEEQKMNPPSHEEDPGKCQAGFAPIEQPQADAIMSGSPHAEVQIGEQAIEAQSYGLQYGGEQKEYTNPVQFRHDVDLAEQPAANSEADETPSGYEEKEYGCERCGNEVPEDLFHKCANKEGRCCLWCFTRQILRNPQSEYCQMCQMPAYYVLNPTILKFDSSLYCEACSKPSNTRGFFHRSRCRQHIICSECACQKLQETNGLNACPHCLIQEEPFQKSPCKKCGNPSSNFVHADQTEHTLCWSCALENPDAAAKCECGSSLTDCLREAMLMKKGNVCYLCKRYRPLRESRCGCKVFFCAECSLKDEKCPKCTEAKTLPTDWINNQKMNCVECLSFAGALLLSCGHYCHRECLRRVGGCSLCPPVVGGAAE